MAALSVFCARNSLTVNLSKTGWVVGGSVPCSGSLGLRLLYKGQEVSPVASYKYLGLVFDGSSTMASATAARLTAA